MKRTLLLVALLTASALAQEKDPYFVDYKVAGLDLLNARDFKPSHDPTTGYYLTYGGD